DGRVLRAEQSAERGSQAEHWKVLPRNERYLTRRRPASVSQVRRHQAARCNPSERAIGRPEVAEHRVAEHLVAVSLDAACPAAPLRPGTDEVDELRRVAHREPPQYELVVEREYGAVEADAGRERQHDDRREGRAPCKTPEGIADIGDRLGEHFGPPHSARSATTGSTREARRAGR